MTKPHWQLLFTGHLFWDRCAGQCFPSEINEGALSVRGIHKHALHELNTGHVLTFFWSLSPRRCGAASLCHVFPGLGILKHLRVMYRTGQAWWCRHVTQPLSMEAEVQGHPQLHKLKASLGSMRPYLLFISK